MYQYCIISYKNLYISHGEKNIINVAGQLAALLQLAALEGGPKNKKLSCRREAARCFMFVCSQLQHAYSAVFLLPVTATSDLLVYKILLWLGYPMVKKFRRYLYSF